MKKEEYLTLLEDVLKQNDVEENERTVIVEDYEELYEGYLESGLTNSDITKKLGTPYNVVKELKGIMRYRKYPNSPHEKVIAISPFIALVVFFLLGFMYNAWHPAWLAFFIVPVSAILLTDKEGIWKTCTAVSPFIITTIYLLYGHYKGVYHPTWLIFLFIMLFGFMTMKESRKYLYIALLVIGTGIYLWIGLLYHVYDISLLAFLPLLVALVYYGHVEIIFNFQKPIVYVALGSLIVYFLSGYFFDLWKVMWLIFFLIPIMAIHIDEKGKSKYIAISPFIAVTIFYLLGFYADLWSVSWLAFLLIPVTAIVLESDKQDN
ncbi:MAG: hypothetical protein ACOC1L_05695 [Bacillota bacterium]